MLGLSHSWSVESVSALLDGGVGEASRGAWLGGTPMSRERAYLLFHLSI